MNGVFFVRFVVFVTYQMYYDYPPPTYLEYPILIAQGEFHNRPLVRPDVTEMAPKPVHLVGLGCVSGLQTD